MRTRLNVNEARVHCPKRGDVDVETCWTCRNLEELRFEHGDEAVLCSPPAARPIEDPLLIRW
jgi:hypothetical protein